MEDRTRDELFTLEALRFICSVDSSENLLELCTVMGFTHTLTCSAELRLKDNWIPGFFRKGYRIGRCLIVQKLGNPQSIALDPLLHDDFIAI
ncbi:hypothetical protein D3C81_1467520 [compost metagenome]